MNSHRVGDIAEAHVLATLSEHYQAVLIPFGNGQRYDFVVDSGKAFFKVQVKNGRLRKGVIRFNAHSVKSYVADYDRDYKDDVDFFAVWCPETEKVYMIPIDHITSQKPHLRVTPTKNCQQAGVRPAVDYEL